jgi:hypothetical protein
MRCLVEQALLNSRVGVDAPVAEKRPMGAVLVDPLPFHLGENNFFAIHARLGQDLAARRNDEALPPKLNPFAADGHFVSDTIDRGDEAAVRDRVAALHRFPGGMLRVTVFGFLRRMPADRSRIKRISAPRTVVRRAASGYQLGIADMPKCLRRAAEIALTGVPVSTPRRAGLPLISARRRK